MTTEKDIIWVWDTEYDKKQAEQLEKRVKQKIIEEIEKDMKIMEDIALNLFGKQQVRWRHTKLTKEFNEILEINSNRLIDRTNELKEILKTLGEKE